MGGQGVVAGDALQFSVPDEGPVLDGVAVPGLGVEPGRGVAGWGSSPWGIRRGCRRGLGSSGWRRGEVRAPLVVSLARRNLTSVGAQKSKRAMWGVWVVLGLARAFSRRWWCSPGASDLVQSARLRVLGRLAGTWGTWAFWQSSSQSPEGAGRKMGCERLWLGWFRDPEFQWDAGALGYWGFGLRVLDQGSGGGGGCIRGGAGWARGRLGLGGWGSRGSGGMWFLV